MNSRFSRSSFAARLPRYSHHFRAATALGLVLTIFLTSLFLHVSAAPTSSEPTAVENDHFLIYQGENGDTVCREADALERRELQKIVPRNLRQINHAGENGMAESNTDFATSATAPSTTSTKTPSPSATTTENAATNLTIILRATSNLDANPSAKAAFLRAAAAWDHDLSRRRLRSG
jgi:hypothetical protein